MVTVVEGLLAMAKCEPSGKGFCSDSLTLEPIAAPGGQLTRFSI
jgi:hypothetical protein